MPEPSILGLPSLADVVRDNGRILADAYLKCAEDLEKEARRFKAEAERLLRGYNAIYGKTE